MKRNRSNGKFVKSDDPLLIHESINDQLCRNNVRVVRRKENNYLPKIFTFFLVIFFILPWVFILAKNKKFYAIKDSVEELFNESFSCKQCNCNCTNDKEKIKENF